MTSLVEGLLVQLADVYRPTATDDGQGGKTMALPGSPLLKDVQILVTNKSSFVPDGKGGRMLKETWKSLTYYQDGSLFQTNDVLSNLRDSDGNVVSFLVNGTARGGAWKVKNSVDPNLLHDHIETDLEVFAGRTKGTP